MNETSETALHRRGPVDGRAILGLVAAVASMALIALPLLAVAAAAVAIALAISSRSRLRSRPELRGARVGVAAMLLSIVTLCLTAIPALLSVIIVATGAKF